MTKERAMNVMDSVMTSPYWESASTCHETIPSTKKRNPSAMRAIVPKVTLNYQMLYLAAFTPFSLML